SSPPAMTDNAAEETPTVPLRRSRTSTASSPFSSPANCVMATLKRPNRGFNGARPAVGSSCAPRGHKYQAPTPMSDASAMQRTMSTAMLRQDRTTSVLAAGAEAGGTPGCTLGGGPTMAAGG